MNNRRLPKAWLHQEHFQAQTIQPLDEAAASFIVGNAMKSPEVAAHPSELDVVLVQGTSVHVRGGIEISVFLAKADLRKISQDVSLVRLQIPESVSKQDDAERGSVPVQSVESKEVFLPTGMTKESTLQLMSSWPEGSVCLILVAGGADGLGQLLVALEAAGILTSDLASTYQLAEKLGSGGEADVYVGKRLQVRQNDKKTVALKILRAPAKEECPETIKQEVEMLAQVQHHPNVLELCGIMQGKHPVSGKICWVLATSFCDQGDLYSRAQQHPLSEANAQDIILGLLEALAFIHERGVVHRDVKCDNILLTGSGPVLADFGVACRLKDAARMRERVGSIGWLAPEMVDKTTTYDAKVDVFGTGCSMYFAMTGGGPFGHTKAKIRSNNFQGKLVLDLETMAKMSSEGRNFLMALLAQKSQRPSAKEASCNPWFTITPGLASAESGLGLPAQEGITVPSPTRTFHAPPAPAAPPCGESWLVRMWRFVSGRSPLRQAPDQPLVQAWCEDSQVKTKVGRGVRPVVKLLSPGPSPVSR